MLTIKDFEDASKLLENKHEPIVLIFTSKQVDRFKKEGENVDEKNMTINGCKFFWQKPWEDFL